MSSSSAHPSAPSFTKSTRRTATFVGRSFSTRMEINNESLAMSLMGSSSAFINELWSFVGALSAFEIKILISTEPATPREAELS